ncbi:MAG: PAS domain S-box protein [Candidatus Kariarchaeaceae archaeon]|jgi:PAS domain S-box-containing protein
MQTDQTGYPSIAFLNLNTMRVLLFFAAVINLIFGFISNFYLDIKDPMILRISISLLMIFFIVLSITFRLAREFNILVHIAAVLTGINLYAIAYLNKLSDRSIAYVVIYLALLGFSQSYLFINKETLIGYTASLSLLAIILPILVKADSDSTILFIIASFSVTSFMYLASIARIQNLQELMKLKIIDETLQRTEVQLQTVISNAPLVLWSLDKNGIFTLSEGKSLEDLGLKPGQVVGGSVWEIYKDFPDILKAQKKALAGEIVHTRTKVGDIYFENSYNPIFSSNGQVEGMIGVAVNITEQMLIEQQLKESESRYRLLFDSAPLGAVVMQDGMCKFANPAFIEMFGYDSVDEIIEMQSVNLVPEELQEKLLPREIQQQKGEKVQNSYDSYGLRKDGSVFPIHNEVTKIEYLGNPAVLAFYEDITSQRMSEEERLRKMRLESISLLAGGIAHDFNNMLMTMLGNVNIIQSTPDINTLTRVSLSDIEKTISQASKLTRQLLTFSKGGEPIIKAEWIKPIIQDAVTLSMSGSNSKYDLYFEDDLPAVDIDAGQITQVINNLVINAIQAMPHGGLVSILVKKKHVKLTDEMSLQDGDYVLLEIKDTGTGIPDDIRDKMFIPYFTTKTEGYGLGLATSYSIVKKHNGYITFLSDEEGSSFFIYLPISKHTPVSVSQPKITDYQFSGRVLLMDDDISIQKTVKRMLENLGFTVTLAKDGNECIQHYQQAVNEKQPFLFVIMDLIIPGGMSGAEAVEHILQIDPKAIVIVSSGYSNDPVLANHKSYGFHSMLAKPYTMRELKIHIAKLLKIPEE